MVYSSVLRASVGRSLASGGTLPASRAKGVAPRDWIEEGSLPDRSSYRRVPRPGAGPECRPGGAAARRRRSRQLRKTATKGQSTGQFGTGAGRQAAHRRAQRAGRSPSASAKGTWASAGRSAATGRRASAGAAPTEGARSSASRPADRGRFASAAPGTGRSAWQIEYDPDTAGGWWWSEPVRALPGQTQALAWECLSAALRRAGRPAPCRAANHAPRAAEQSMGGPSACHEDSAARSDQPRGADASGASGAIPRTPGRASGHGDLAPAAAARRAAPHKLDKTGELSAGRAPGATDP